jgi:hypothetical protein
VQKEDIFTAEAQFSVDMLDELRYEIRDNYPDFPDFALSFLNVSAPMTEAEVAEHLREAHVPEEKLAEVRDILLWFSFLGVHLPQGDTYSYEVFYDVPKLQAQGRANDKAEILYTIHPAFKQALTV